MTLDAFKDILFDRAKKEGFSEYEIYYVDGENFKISVYEKEIDQYSVNTKIGLSFRGLYHGKMGYAYTEILDNEAIELLIKNAKANAMAIENEDIEVIYGEKDTYAEVKGYNEALETVSVDEKIELALALEKNVHEQSDKVKGVEYCLVQSSKNSRRIINSKGLDVQYKSNGIAAVLIPIIQDGEKMITGEAFKVTNIFEEINPQQLAKEAVADALAYIGAEAVESGNYPIALRNDVAADLLATFSGIFSADNVQKGLSLLKGKMGKQIGSSKLTILDDPLLKNGICSTPFDDEGVATYTKTVVEKGRLHTFLYNLKTAMKDGVKTTGNASKSSYASPVDIAPTNFYIQPGEKSFEQLLKNLDDGILITQLQGMHSGTNAVTGDFSLAAKGFLVKKGKIKRPIEQITVSGNFFKVLENIEQVGADLKFGMPTGQGCFGSPTLLITQLSIAGK
ncbi:MAG: PmbA protein [Clostridiales bacterium]|jgi:PmbA protein|nr:PmbA protein [Clostridiales bacterium]MDK2934882.1 PmbA protein [Clostridiales bacterium]